MWWCYSAGSPVSSTGKHGADFGVRSQAAGFPRLTSGMAATSLESGFLGTPGCGCLAQPPYPWIGPCAVAHIHLGAPYCLLAEPWGSTGHDLESRVPPLGLACLGLLTAGRGSYPSSLDCIYPKASAFLSPGPTIQPQKGLPFLSQEPGAQ